MREYLEIRVRPVVRYVVTRFRCDDVGGQVSDCLGEFDSVQPANEVASVLAAASSGAVCEPARQLKIGWLRGPGEARDRIRWELMEDDAPAAVRMVG